MANIEVILKEDVNRLGSEGEIKKVAVGYARNYLFPFGYAVIKNKWNLKKLEKEKDLIDKRKSEKLENSKSLLEKINSLTLNFNVYASDNGKLFGSININDIYNRLNKEGFEINKNNIRLLESIKYIGEYKIDIMLYSDLKAILKIVVLNKDKIEKNNNSNDSNNNDSNNKKDLIEN